MSNLEVIKPYPDQQVAIDKFRKVKACLIGDSMGVGKTVTAIGRDLQMREDDSDVTDLPTLIICEKIGIDVWVWHLRAMGVPDVEIVAIDPADRSEFLAELVHDAAYQSKKSKKPPRGVYYVVHWDIIMKPYMDKLWSKRTRTGKLPYIQWAHVIADEAHLIKNRDALKTKALKKINTSYKSACTGTPADDKPWDIWSLLNWLYPSKYRSYWRFYENHVQWIAASEYNDWEEWKESGGDYESFRKYQTEKLKAAEEAEYRKTGKRVKARPSGFRKPVGVRNIPELHEQIDPFYIRRTLLEVDPNMPEKIHVDPPIVVDMGARQRREYEAMRDKAIALIGADDSGVGGFQLLAPEVVAVLTRLQQMSLATLAPQWDILDDEFVDDEEEMNWDFPKIVLSKPSPKLDAVMNMITTHEEEPFVVFTQFRGMADLVEEECQRLKISVVKIHGGILSKDTRTRLVQEFQDGKARVFVGTIAAAGKTITLTRANHVIFTDLSWNPSKNEQAEDRLWRRTQTNAVRVYNIQSKDSIDQIRAARIKEKGDWIRALLDPRTMQ